MKRPALIFDFGNVVAFFDYARMGARLGPYHGLSGEQFLENIRAAGFTPLHQRYEAGRLSAEEFRRAFLDLSGLTVSTEQFVAAWNDIFWLNGPVAQLIADLKAQGFTLVLGSNTNDLHAAHFRDQFAEALRPFDALVLSYEVGHIKPAAEFYRACVAAAGAEPANCVFIDDLPDNVAGARAVGLAGVVYKDTPALIENLARLGVEIRS